MKNGCFHFYFLLTVSCAVLMRAPSSAAPLPQGSSEPPAKTIRDQQQVSIHATAAQRSVGGSRASKIFAGPGFPMEREHFPTRSRSQPGASRSGVVALQFQNNGIGYASAVVPTAIGHSNDARHRSSNPAVVGGPASSDTRNIGGINGTRAPRKP